MMLDELSQIVFDRSPVMTTNKQTRIKSEYEQDRLKSEKRKKYHSPALKHWGDVRGITLGGSLGTGDSGDPGAQQPIVGS